MKTLSQIIAKKTKKILREAEKRTILIKRKYGFWKPVLICGLISAWFTGILSALSIEFINLNPGLVFQCIFCFLAAEIIYFKHVYAFARQKKFESEDDIIFN